MSRLLLLACTGLVCACGGDDPPAETEATPFGAVLGPDEVRAGRIEDPALLIGGDTASAQSGHAFLLYNDRVRWALQDETAAIGANIYGASLVDADLVREGPGLDTIREMFPTVGLRVVAPTAVSVVSDGTDGAAVVEVRGTDADPRILPPVVPGGLPLEAEVRTRYLLRPGSTVLELTTTTIAGPGAGRNLDHGEFVSFGHGQLFTAERGFGDLTLFAVTSYLIHEGPHAAYGLVVPGEQMLVPFTENASFIALYNRPLWLPANGEASYRRLLVMGADLAEVQEQLHGVLEIAGGVVTGVLSDGAGAPVAEGYVAAFAGPWVTGRIDAASRARTRPDGSYRMHLPPGAYDLVAAHDGYGRSGPLGVTVAADTEQEADLALGATATLQLEVRDASSGELIPAKLSLRADAWTEDVALGTPERAGLAEVAMTGSGTLELAMPPGRYHAVVSRGFEYDWFEADVELTPGATTPLLARITRVVDTAGWVACDFHQHTTQSIDGHTTVRERLLENAAEGVEYAPLTDHDNVVDASGVLLELGLERWTRTAAGDEISVTGTGHFIGWPFAIDAADPYRDVGMRFWVGLTIADLFDKTRAALQSGGVLHVAHPRSDPNKGYFVSVGLSPIDGSSLQPFAAGFDALELNLDLGEPEDFLPEADARMAAAAVDDPTDIPVMRDWFHLLSSGAAVAGIAGSDVHGKNEGAGVPRTWVRTDDSDLSTLEPLAVAAAVHAQAAIVSSGPFIRATLNGVAALGHLEPVQSGAENLLAIAVHAAPWVDVDTVEVYWNGRPMTLSFQGDRWVSDSNGGLRVPVSTHDGVVRFEGTVVLPAGPGYAVVLARGDQAPEPVYGFAPLAVTNPIYVSP